jgi:glycosyltransferase involved in cell wall biosynthesis
MKPGISLCMIVKNEERFLEGCLKSVQGIVDEIIIVDTGSTDSTIDIARRYTSDIYTFQWIDDFSAARNFAISKAGCEWILSLDADERIRDVDLHRLRRELHSDKDAFDVTIMNEQLEDSLLNVSIHRAIRLFRNHPDIYFENRVHEDVSPSLFRKNARIAKAPFNILHLGYKEFSTEKKTFILQLLEREFRQKPQDFATAFYYANQLYILSEYEQAIHIFQVAEKLFDPTLHSKELFCELKIRAAFAHLKNGNTANALQEVEEFMQHSTRCPNPWYYQLLIADIYMSAELFKPALEIFLRIEQEYRKNKELQSFLKKEKLYIQIGNLYYKQQDFSNAYRYYSSAVELDSRDEKVLVLAGMTALLLERKNEAKRYFQSILDINPSNPTARKGLLLLGVK